MDDRDLSDREKEQMGSLYLLFSVIAVFGVVGLVMLFKVLELLYYSS
jgi:hypothetical protein